MGLNYSDTLDDEDERERIQYKLRLLGLPFDDLSLTTRGIVM